jgi:hypothetical protein
MNLRLWEEVLAHLYGDSKALTVHRRRLARALSCHEIPRPNLRGHGLVVGHDSYQEPQLPLIDMSTTQLCNSLFCLHVAMVERKSEKGEVHRLAQRG